MGMCSCHIRIDNKQFEEFRNSPHLLEEFLNDENIYESENCIWLEKAWDGILYILNGKGMHGIDINDINGRVVFSGQVFDEEENIFGYGPTHFLTPSQVKESGELLQKWTKEGVLSRVNHREMKELEIYPDIWGDEESSEYLFENFVELQEFYKHAVNNSEAVISFVS